MRISIRRVLQRMSTANVVDDDQDEISDKDKKDELLINEHLGNCGSSAGNVLQDESVKVLVFGEPSKNGTGTEAILDAIDECNKPKDEQDQGDETYDLLKSFNKPEEKAANFEKPSR